MRKSLLRKIIFLVLLVILIATAGQLWDSLPIPVYLKFSENRLADVLLVFVLFIFGDSIITSRLLKEANASHVFVEFTDKALKWFGKLGLGYSASPHAMFSTLARSHTHYAKTDLRQIRTDVDRNSMNYLKPLDPSLFLWGQLFDQWNTKVPSTRSLSGVRWALLSDLYLRQELDDLSDSRFATDLNLYAKSILLNLYLSVNNNSSDQTVIAWVFTKMLPTDWPLCQGVCRAATVRCISGRSSNEERFLRGYSDSLKQCATLPHFENLTSFCRHIIVTHDEHPRFKTHRDLNVSMSSHSNEYFNALHKNSAGNTFGKSFSMKLNDSQANSWPEILSDATFYGTQGGGDILWRWAICTTYA